MSGSIPCQAKTREVIGTGNIRNRTNRVSAQGVQTRRRSMVPRYRFHDSDSTTSGRFLHSPLQTRCSVSTSPRLARCLATLGRHARPVLDEVFLPLVVSSHCRPLCPVGVPAVAATVQRARCGIADPYRCPALWPKERGPRSGPTPMTTGRATCYAGCSTNEEQPMTGWFSWMQDTQ